MSWYAPGTWLAAAKALFAPTLTPVPELRPLEPEPGDECPGELVVQELTGLPIIWKPLRADGRTIFDDHPACGLTTEVLAHEAGMGTESAFYQQYVRDQGGGPIMSVADWAIWAQAGCSVRVQMPRGEAKKFWGGDANGCEGMARRFVPEALANLRASEEFGVAGKQHPNVLVAEALDTPGATERIAPDDASAMTVVLDTQDNAIITVGTGKTWPTITQGVTASASGDNIEVYATAGNLYAEVVSNTTKNIIILNKNDNAQGLTIKTSNATGLIQGGAATPGWYLIGFTLENTHATAPIVYIISNYSYFFRCRLQNSKYGYNITGGTPSFIDCIFDGLTTAGGQVGGGAAYHYNCTVANCNTGFSRTAGTLYCSGCLSGGNATADYTGAVTGLFNVSGDLTAPGSYPTTGFLVADWVSLADPRLLASVAVTTKAHLIGYWNVSLRDVYVDALRRSRPPTGQFFAGAYHCFTPPTWGPGEVSGIN